MEEPNLDALAVSIVHDIVKEIEQHHAYFTKSRSIEKGPRMIKISGGLDCLEKKREGFDVAYKIETKDTEHGTTSDFLISLTGDDTLFIAELTGALKKEGCVYETSLLDSKHCIEGSVFTEWESPQVTITLDLT